MLPMSRGESFLENRVFSNPDTVEWESLDEQTRRDFVDRFNNTSTLVIGSHFSDPSAGHIVPDGKAWKLKV